jgi:hypothetical protein
MQDNNRVKLITSQIEENDFCGVDYIMLGVSREEVENLDIRRMKNNLECLLKIDYAKKFCERIDITVSGYDEDKKELCEFPEVRTFIFLLDKEFPYWFFYLSKFSTSLRFITFSLCNFEKRADRLLYLIQDETLETFFRRHFAAMNEMCDLVGFGEKEIEDLSERVSAYLGISK